MEELQSTGSSNYNPTFKFSVDQNKDIRGILAHGSYNYSLVEFDVAVTAERSGNTGGSAKVYVVSVEAGGKISHQEVSRVKFTVPVELPIFEHTTEKQKK